MKKKFWTVLIGILAGAALAGEFGGVIKGTSGFEASFKSPAAPGRYANDPGALGADQDHEYDNGYVRDNLLSPGATPDWGFDRKSQAAPLGGNYNNGATLTFSSSKMSRPGMGGSEDADGLEPGFELFYRTNPWGTDYVSFGLLGAFTYQHVSIEQSGIAFWQTETTRDQYTYNGVFPNVGDPAFPEPYDNTDPTLLLPDVPHRNVSRGTGAYRYSREIDADLFGLKLGPNVEVMLIENFFLQIGMGASVQWIQSEFSYRDGAVSGETTDSGVLFGGYVQGDLQYAVTDKWRVFLGAEWSAQESFDQKVDGYESELKGSSLISGRFGISRQF